MGLVGHIADSTKVAVSLQKLLMDSTGLLFGIEISEELEAKLIKHGLLGTQARQAGAGGGFILPSILSSCSEHVF